jgi:hypothetical protein
MRFQMPSPEEMFRQNDRNGDGRLDSREINSNPFLPRMLERAGVDTSRDISERDFTDAMDQARRNFEQNGGRGRGGPGPGSERGPERRREGDDEERRRRYEDEREEDENQDDREQDDSGAESRPERRSNDLKPRPRVTIDLQEDLVAGDADGDGQIAFLEWRSWDGKSLKEFAELDTNGDGFVTPREVEAIRGSDEDKEETQVAFADRRGPRDRDSESEDDSADETRDEDEGERAESDADSADADGRDDERNADENSDERDEERGDRRSFRRDDDEERDRDSDESPDEARAAAERYFRLLDRDRDGEIASDEWQGGRIRGMFEDDGIDLDDSMSEDDFIDNYVRLSADGG